jgi:hypothetical protein
MSAFDQFSEPNIRDALETLIESLNSTVNVAVTSAEYVGSDSLRKLLTLVSTVSLEVQNSFSQILAILIKLKYISSREEIRKILRDFDYHRYGFGNRQDVLYCYRLRELCESYQSLVLPELVKANLEDLESWLRVFFEFEHLPGSVLNIERVAYEELRSLLQELERNEQPERQDYEVVKEKSTAYIVNLNNSLAELQVLNNKILGLSGRTGFLELVNDPERLKQASISIVKDVTEVDPKNWTGK